jgi:hypothetical protein
LSSAGRVDVADEAFEQICAFVLAVFLGVIALADQDREELGGWLSLG